MIIFSRIVIVNPRFTYLLTIKFMYLVIVFDKLVENKLVETL